MAFETCEMPDREGGIDQKWATVCLHAGLCLKHNSQRAQLTD